MLISIITATYNSQQFVHEALSSFAIQDYQEKELIVIDGASKDATLSIVREQLTEKDILLSQPDLGIYDALNKGINLAKGEIIGILHSDDLFASPQVLSKVMQKFKDNPTIQAVYGDLQYVDRKDTTKVIRHWNSGVFSRNEMKRGWMPPHPTLFIRKECFTKYGTYNLSYHSAADYDLILRMLYKEKIKTTYIPEVLVKMRVGGLSNHSLKNRWRANKEDRKAMRINGIPFHLWASFLKPLRKLSQFWKT
ncbi:MAG: glycosyltransferase family 2 protein [Pelobium sp.]